MGKSHVYVLARLAAAATRGVKRFYSLSRQNTFVGGTCAPSSALLVSNDIINIINIIVCCLLCNYHAQATRHIRHLLTPELAQRF